MNTQVTFQVRDEGKFRLPVADLTQEGKQRLQVPSDSYLRYPTTGLILLPAGVGDDDMRMLLLDSMGLRLADYRPRERGKDAVEIGDLNMWFAPRDSVGDYLDTCPEDDAQKALRPPPPITDAAVIASESFVDTLTRACRNYVGAISILVRTHPREEDSKNAWDTLDGNDDAAIKELNALTPAGFITTVRNVCSGDEWDQCQRDYIHAHIKALDEAFLLFPVFAAVVQDWRNSKITSAVKIPNSISTHLSDTRAAALVWWHGTVTVDEADFDDPPARGGFVPVADSGAPIVWALVDAEQVTTGTREQIGAFASARGTIRSWGVVSSDHEVTQAEVSAKIGADTALAAWWALNNPLVGAVCNIAAVISYLKSGHHALARNLDNTMAKIGRALGMDWQASAWAALVSHGTYHGAHPSDDRLVILYLHEKDQDDQLSRAIMLRLRTAGPGVLPLVTLDVFIRALFNSGYFTYAVTDLSYSNFRRCMDQLLLNAWQSYPYSRWMFGESAPLDPNALAEVERFYSIAAAAKDAMPGSSIHMSESFTKRARDAASNQILAVAQVDAFVAGMRRFLRTIVQNRLRGQLAVAAIKAPEGAEED